MIEKIILGTVQLGLDYGVNNQHGKPSKDQSFEILKVAYDNGIHVLDTAEAYGNSQEVIGEFHKAFPNKNFKVITKLSANHNLTREDFIPNIIENCKILGVKKLHGFMFHNYDSFVKNISFYDEILKAKEIGLIDYAGISLYSNEEIEIIVSEYYKFDFIQIPFNLLDNDSKRKEVILKAKSKNIDIHTRSVFLQGLFFSSISNLSKKMTPLIPHLKNINEIRKSSGLSIEEIALHYVLQKEYIDHVLVGVENVSQLKSNISTFKKKIDIPHKDLNKIDILEVDLLNPSNWR